MRHIFLISDRTGVTIASLANSLISQFPDLHPQYIQIPFVDSEAKVSAIIEQIKEVAETDEKPPLVFSSLVEPDMRQLLEEGSPVTVLDLFGSFIGQLEVMLGKHSMAVAGHVHGLRKEEEYDKRVAALNFSLATDDGACTDRCSKADVILTGVSRSGKTPTSLFMAMHHGLYVANYPLDEDDLISEKLPKILAPYKDKLFGLTISAERLHNVREERRPNSEYASLARCRTETARARALFEITGVPYIDSTAISIEEISAIIMHRMKISPRHF